MVEKVNLADKLATFLDYWNPKLVGQVNDFHVKLAKLKGEFLWHYHVDEGEFFRSLKDDCGSNSETV